MATSTTTSYTSTGALQAAQSYLNTRLANGFTTVKSRSTPFTIPIIDIAPSFSTSLADRQAVAAQISSACKNSGFFHITGHGVPEPTRQATLALSARFFKSTPREKKEKLHAKHSPYLRGYEPADYTYVNPDDWAAEDAAPETKEGFNWGYEAGLDPTGGDGQYRELDGKDVNGNVWPEEEDVPGFYETIKLYYGEILDLARHLFRLFALSLDLSEDYFDHMMTHPGGIARLLYYPASSNPQPLNPNQKDEEIGLGAHSDYECFTILLCSAAPGLEILSPDDTWVPAPAVEGSFIINVADFLMRWTNGVYRSTVHRVVNRTREERFSVPFFFSVNYDQTVEVRRHRNLNRATCACADM
ncbi:hypothetical protein LTR53_010409 [Teratosphaeriaceae sp. CCFEE 6253]|nr:hypothetical protein LTR53_010409 [Teratosphaeriaceae sp. CCFEE 6253]